MKYRRILPYLAQLRLWQTGLHCTFDAVEGDEMSGGSYDYLYFKDFEVGDGSQEHLRNMIERLKELGMHNAAEASQEVYDRFFPDTTLDVVEDEYPKLRDVWHTVEWLDSNDIGPDTFDERIKRTGWR